MLLYCILRQMSNVLRNNYILCVLQSGLTAHHKDFYFYGVAQTLQCNYHVVGVTASSFAVSHLALKQAIQDFYTLGEHGHNNKTG